MKHLLTRLLAPLLFCISLNAQKHDYMWLMAQDRNQYIPGVDGYIMDFNEAPVDVYYITTTMNLERNNASICDTAGNFLFYTNGIFIANAIHEQMENGGGLNPGQFTDDFTEHGLPIEQGVIFLPFPDKDSLYFLLHLARDWSGIVSPGSYVRRCYYSLIDQRLDNHRGGVIDKNHLIIGDTLNVGKLCAVKHANGRDWWSIIQEYDTNRFYRMLINPDGIHLHEPQTLASAVYSGAGQVVFSPDGAKFVQYTLRSLQLGHFIYIYDFDRCTGLLSNPVVINFLDDEIIAGGAAISPNSRYLYISAFRYIYQYDLWADDIAATKDTVAVYDGFLSPFTTAFYFCQLAPDGKIYINAPSGVDVMHVINNPNLPGLLCDVCQHCVQLPTYNAFSMPNFPNYRLGALEGSPCDTLRQLPTAAWSYDAEALDLAFQDGSYHDIRTWHWDFGDGVTDTTANPVHTYAAEGVYQVCLAVSNPRGADTLCQQVQVIINGVADVEGSISASISPNPVTNEKALLRLQALVKLKLNNPQVIIRDALGHELLREPVQVIDGKAQKELAIGTFPTGLYFCTVEAEGKVIWQGKLVK